MKSCISKLFLALVSLALPTLVQGQFTLMTNGGTIIITGFNSAAAGRNIVIPAATNGYPVVRIENGAFQFSTLTNLVLPNSLTSIGNYAFYGCASLPNVTLPASITNLGHVPFTYCVRLTNITVNAACPAYSSVDGVLFDKTQSTLIEFPDGLSGSYNIPNGVTSIGFSAFSSARLGSVSIPASVANITDYAFFGCPNLTNITVNAANVAYSGSGAVLFNKTQTTLLQFPSGVSGSYNVAGYRRAGRRSFVCLFQSHERHPYQQCEEHRIRFV